MEDVEPISFPRGSATSGPRGIERAPHLVAFDRHELSHILNVYGRMVAAGQWRDYAIDHSRETATFSIYRRTSEMPLYRIVKNPRLARRQGTYMVIGVGGQILKRGHSLNALLKFFEKRRLKVVPAD